MKPLALRTLYSREDVHSIFSPDTTFTPQAGTWGLHGIIKIPARENDFVFFVTYGQSQGDHDFDEGITSDGVLSWQSQPRQDLNNKVIQGLISHNDLVDNIYLFLRESKGEAYQYLGRLAYLEHDNTRERPVYFQWQLLDWDESNVDGGRPKDESPAAPPNYQIPADGALVQSDKLPTKKRQGVDRESFRSRKSPDYAKRDAKNRKLGLDGELLVLKYERARLVKAGRSDLSQKITHTSVVEGDGAGYDIKSFSEDGSPRYIEVKTTRGSASTEFFMSPNELKFSEKNSQNFFLYRLYDFDDGSGDVQFYLVKGNIRDYYMATPVSYKMAVK